MKNTLELELQTTQTKITFCYGKRAYEKYIKKSYGIDETIGWNGRSIELQNKERYEIVIGVRKFQDIYSLKGLIVHEISHAVSQWMEYFNFNCDELRSYTLQYLYEEIMPFLDGIVLKKDM